MNQHELDRLLHEHWMKVSQSERFITVAGMYEAEKALIQRHAPESYSPFEVTQFVFFHIHGHEMLSHDADRIMK